MKTLIRFFGEHALTRAQAVLGTGIFFHAVAGFFLVLLVLLGALIVKWLLNTIVKRITARTASELDDRILEIVVEKVMPISTILGFYLGLRELRGGIPASSTSFFQFLDLANGALFVLMAIVITIGIIKIVDLLIMHGLRKIAQREASTFDTTMSPLINRVTNILLVVIAIIVVLEHFGQDVSSLLVSLGVGSLALALAAQDTLSNMIAGFVIMLDRPFRVGDRVKLPTGEEGDVHEIGMRSTKILDFDNNLQIVPNNELIKARIVNYSYPNAQARVVVEVNVAFDSDIKVAKSIMAKTASTHPLVLKNPKPEVYLMKVGDFSLQFKLFCRVASYKDQFAVTENLRINVFESLRENGIRVPYPQSEITLSKERNSNVVSASQKRKKA